MEVRRCRYRVVYRLVNMVYAMVVAPAAANVFFALQLLDPITRLLIAASRGVEVTPDKLTKRYSEVCFLTSHVSQLSSLAHMPIWLHGLQWKIAIWLKVNA